MSGPLIDRSAPASHPASWDRGQLVRRAGRLAVGLRERGVRPGDRVALVAPNGPGFVAGLLALMQLDVSIVLVDATAEDHRVADHCRRAEVTGVVLSSSPRQVAGLTVVGLPGPDARDGEPAPTERSARPADDPVAAWWRRADALVVFSSGTTGAPSVIVRSGPSLVANLRRTQDRMDYRADDVLLPLLPFSHQYGLSLVLLWWLSTATLVVVPPTALPAALAAVVTAGVTVVDATPATYHSWLRLLARRRPAAPDPATELRGVRLWCVGGAPCGAALRDAFGAAVGRPLLDGYGSSELGNVALAGPADPIACGRPLPGLRIEVVDDGGSPVPCGTVGRIVVHSPDRPVAVRVGERPWSPVDASGFDTRDLGWLDAAGRLTVIGRARAVHRLGHTLYPEALASRAEAAGAPVAVLALPDDRTGCRLVFVVADPTGASAAQWRPRICAHLDAHEWPNLVLVLHRFPVNSAGKVDLAELRRIARQRLTPVPDPADTAPAAPADPVRDGSSPAGRLLVHQGSHPAIAVPAAPPDRWPVLLRLADHLARRPAELIDRLTPVISHRCAEAEIDAAVATLRGAREEIDRYRPGPIDRIAVFMPSNIPLYAYVLYLMVPALYADRVVFRPSGHIRDASIALHEHLAAVHRLDALELNLQTQREFLSGPVAGSDVVVFTGTYANAEKVRGQLRPDQLMIFFGQGINPVVVGPRADVDAAGADVVRIRMINNGQDCFGPDVVFVHDDVADAFVAALRDRLSRLRFGRYADPTADYGPLLYEQALGSAVDHLHRVADSIVHGGSVHLRDRHLEPTVLRRAMPDKLICDELFAPIFNVVTYRAVEDLHAVLQSPFFAERAMGAMVYGAGDETVRLLAARHHVCVDSTLLDDDNGNRPFGGRGIRANYTAIDGARRAEPLLVSKAVADHLGARSGRSGAVGA